MDEPITPALTPEEWAEALDRLDDTVIGRGHKVVMCIEGNQDGSEHYHAAAAIALHGQPFGFTHADAARVRDIAFIAPQPMRANLENLADRIEVLLPPRQP